MGWLKTPTTLLMFEFCEKIRNKKDTAPQHHIISKNFMFGKGLPKMISLEMSNPCHSHLRGIPIWMSRHPSKPRGGFKDYSCQAKLRGGFSDFFYPRICPEDDSQFHKCMFFFGKVLEKRTTDYADPPFLLSRLQHANPVLNAVNLRSNQISRKKNCWLETISLQEWWLNRGWQPLSHNSAMVLRRRFGHKKKMPTRLCWAGKSWGDSQ